MKKIILIGVLLINICTTTSHAAERKSSLPWVAIPLLGAVMGFGYTYFYQWKEHPDIKKIREINCSSEEAAEANHQLNTTNNPIKFVRSGWRYGKHTAKANVAAVRLDLITDPEHNQLFDLETSNQKKREILDTVWLRAKEKEFTKTNADNIIKYSATGAGIGFGLVAIASIFK